MYTAIYIRQSKEKKDSLSLEGQTDICKKQLADSNEYKIYEDSGFSGKNIERPAMKKLLNDVENGLISRVIVYKLDRISRSILDFNNLLVIFKKYNVEFTSCTENIDTTSPMGRAMTNIVATFAQLERETIALRVKDNYYKRGETGSFLGGTIPYGFNRSYITVNDKKTPVLEFNDKIKIVELMYDLYANSNNTLGEISKHLNSLDIPSPSSGKWNSATISRILRSTLYVQADADIYNYFISKGVNITNSIEDFIGVNAMFMYGRREANERRYTNVKDHYLTIALHEGVIDSRTYLKCQYKLDSNKQICNSGRGKNTFLTGLIKCSKCGYSMSAMKNRVGKKYLVCKGKYNSAACVGHSKAIIVDDIEYIVESKIDFKIKELSKSKIKANKKQNKKINDLKLEVIKIDEDINNLMLKILEANEVVMKYINTKIEELDNKKKDILTNIQKELSKGDDLENIKEVLEKYSNFNNLDFEDKKRIAKLLINKINISEEEVDIDWNV